MPVACGRGETKPELKKTAQNGYSFILTALNPRNNAISESLLALLQRERFSHNTLYKARLNCATNGGFYPKKPPFNSCFPPLYFIRSW
jgi:hypothetical protein